MSDKTDTNDSSIDSGKKARLSLRRETVRSLGVRSGIKTAAKNTCKNGTCADDSQTYSCRRVISSMGTVG